MVMKVRNAGTAQAVNEAIRALHDKGQVSVVSFCEGLPLNLLGRMMPKVAVVPMETCYPGRQPHVRFSGTPDMQPPYTLVPACVPLPAFCGTSNPQSVLLWSFQHVNALSCVQSGFEQPVQHGLVL